MTTKDKEAQSEAPSVYTILSELVRQAELAGSGNIYASDSLSLYLSDAVAKINRLIVEAKRNTLQDVERIMFEWTLSRLIDLKKGISTIAEIEEMCYAGLRNSGNLENQLGENKGENI